MPVTESNPPAAVEEHSPSRYFLDICSSSDAPLAVAAQLAVLVHLDFDPLLGGEAHDLTNPNIVDHVLRQGWSGSVGFAVGTLPRSHRHAELLANLEPLQLFSAQTNILVNQNVIATLTAVHAAGGHVLWVNTPSSATIGLDFVHDFLSNIATFWIWVDACQFDVDDDRTWHFATSTPGLLPLACQCNHAFLHKNTRHPRRSVHHTKFSRGFLHKVCPTHRSFCR